jgi:capsular exopolysaccharide synthesis family protein
MNKYVEFEEENEKPFNSLDIFFKYLLHWKWFLASIVLCSIVAVAYLRYTLPSYEISTSILLKDDLKGGGISEANAFKQMGIFTQKNNVDNELEVLNTISLMEQVVRELGAYVSYTQTGTFPLVRKLGNSMGLTKLGKYKKKVLYGSDSPILIQLPDAFLAGIDEPIEFEILVRPYGEYEFSGIYQEKLFSVKASISDDQVVLPFGKINISRGQYRPVEDMYIDVVLHNSVHMAERMLKQVKMDLTSKTTSVVDITYIAPNVKLGKDVLNKLIEVYNRENMNDQIKMATISAKFIDDRLMTLTRELSDVESQVENYKQIQGLTDIKSESDMFIQQTGDLTQRRMEIGTQLAIVTDIDEYMHRKENRHQLIPASSGINSQGLGELINNYNRLVMEKNRLSRIASDSNQAMIDLTSQIESMFNTVQSSVRNEKMNLQIAQRDLLSKNNENSARIRAIPRLEREYTEIKRQQGVKEALFLFLLQKKEEKYVNMSVVEPISKIIDNVHSNGSPVWPNKSMIGLITLFIGLVIPVVGIKIKELLRYQVYNKEELLAISNVPVLGEIPKTKNGGNDIIIKANSTDSFTEMVRLLRTNLLFVLHEADKKVINVVSSVSGEGKTFVSINLAMSLALLDKKVLIIGLDLRKPKVAEYLKLDNKTGITLYLTGNLERDQLIRSSGIHPNLWVITAGPIPPNPNELLAKSSLDRLIGDLRKQFDYIVIDTAPVGVVSDSFTLNRFADVNLYVVRAEFTHKKNIEDATFLYRNKKLNDLYFVLNNVDNKKNTYRYGYDKKHGNGYGYESETDKV